MLPDIPADTVPDRYGEGGVVAELEGEVAGLLGKPAALFLSSGTMAQQAALRVHADRSGRRAVVFHPTCHLDVHEGEAYQRLHGLVGRPVGDPNRLLTLDDLREVAELPAALLVELPQREIGGQLPAWDDLEEQWRGLGTRWVVPISTAPGLGMHLLLSAVYGRDRRVLARVRVVYKGLGGLVGVLPRRRGGRRRRGP